jgi:hypothetical protein
MTKFELLLQSGGTAFSLNDLVLLWRQPERGKVLESARGYVRAGKLQRLARGVYALRAGFSEKELAMKLNPPAYITGFYVLRLAGAVFQYDDETITCVAGRAASFSVNQFRFEYRRVKKEILFNDLGIEKHPRYWIASPERAAADILYFNKDAGFDNLSVLNHEKLLAAARIYGRKTMLDRVAGLIEGETDG